MTTQGKSMRELHRLVAEDAARFNRLAAAWNNLTVDEQSRLLADAEAVAASDQDYEDSDD